ncbi:MAG: LPS export ABC transporter periplasmic protein LptC, partial [Acidobacteria bacterium]|nr:LPS export ABC transporter periplasmic protein LptC [Acidobacteriota bacterium]
RPSVRTVPPRNDVAPTLVEEAKGELKDRVRFRGFAYEETRPDEGTYVLKADEAIGFREDGNQVFRLKDADLESTNTRKERVTLTAPRAEFSQTSRKIRVEGGVRIQGEGISLTGAAFRYLPDTRSFVSEGPVSAFAAGLTGRARSGRLESEAGVVHLEGEVRVRGRDDTNSALSLTAPRAQLSREGRLDADGGVVLKTDEALLRARSVTRTREAEGDHARADGDVELLVTATRPARGAEPGDGSPMRAEGDALDLVRNASGQPQNLDLSRAEPVARVDVLPTGSVPARRVLGPRFLATFAEGRLSEVLAPGGADSLEGSRLPVPVKPKSLGSGSASAAGSSTSTASRQLVAGSARLQFLEDGRSLDLAVFEGGVRLRDGESRTLLASRGTVRGREDSAVFEGTEAEAARFEDPKASIRARVLTYQRKLDQLDASGDVKAVFRDGSGRTLPGGKSGEPFNSNSATLRFMGPEKKAILTGNVKVWQNDSVLRCATLTLDDAAKELHAEGEVQASLRRRKNGPNGKPTGIIETITASGNSLTHQETRKVIRVEGKAVLLSGPWKLNADIADIKLGPEDSVQYAESRGNVVLEDQTTRRRGEGQKAIWRPEQDLVTLDGTPATAFDGIGNRVTGAQLRFKQGQSRIDVESSTETGIEVIARPPGKT